MTTNRGKGPEDSENSGVVSEEPSAIGNARDNTSDALTKLLAQDVSNTDSGTILAAVLGGIDNSELVSSRVDLLKTALESDDLQLLDNFFNVGEDPKELNRRLAITRLILSISKDAGILKDALGSDNSLTPDQLSKLKDSLLGGYDIEKVRVYFIDRANNDEFISRCELVDQALSKKGLKIRRPSSDYFINPSTYGTHQFFDIVAA